MPNNGSSARLDRIEKLIEESERINKEANARHEARHEREMARHEREMAAIRAEGLRTREDIRKTREETREDIRRTREDMRRWVTLGVKEARNHRKRLTELEAKSAAYRSRTDQNLAEITDKLNGLIGYVDGLARPEKRQ